HLRFDSAVLIEREESAPDPALICNDDEFESSRFQTSQRLKYTWKNPYILRMGTIIGIFHDRAIAIDKDGRRQRVTHLPCPLENWRRVHLASQSPFQVCSRPQRFRGWQSPPLQSESRRRQAQA